MMEEFYGIQSTTNAYSMQVPSDNMATPAANYYHHMAFQSPAGATSFPVFVSEDVFCGSSVSDAASKVAEIHHQQQKVGGSGDTSSNNNNPDEEVSSAIRAKIASHPLYPKLLEAYIDCQKVGAPPEMAYLFDEIRQENDVSNKYSNYTITSCLGADPELDEFMETYCDVLIKYRADLSRPFDEATAFLNDVEAQFNTLCSGASRSYIYDHEAAVVSSDEDAGSGEEAEVQDYSHRTNDQDPELKHKLLRKYGGYISTLKHEFTKKKRKGKLPKDARQILLNWWNIHYKWPYPTEADKVGLAESTGLDQKQINNWFINQRKRHWKPSENMQFAVVDSLYGPFLMND